MEKSVRLIEHEVPHLPPDAVIFSMIQPTGPFHLGNYLGANKTWKQINDHKLSSQTCLFGVADLHAITVPQLDPLKFKQMRINAIASILSLGISPEKCIISFQSMIPEHSQLNWLLSTISSMGYLNRMTQWKSKKGGTVDTDKVELGLFAYPVLQAADILLYGSTHVPVGEDQSQHLELTRHIARKFNKMYGEVFVEPQTLLTPTKRVSSLTDPTRKMSKSEGSNPMSLIYLSDPPEVIQQKIKKCFTDSISDTFYYDPVERPGVSNLINIVSGLQDKPMSQIVEEDLSTIHDYPSFKQYISDVIVEHLNPIRTRYYELVQDPGYLLEVATRGSLGKARPLAQETLGRVMATMGF